MVIQLTVHISWAGHPILARLHLLEQARDAGDDADDLSTLLDGIDAPEEPAPKPATPPKPPWCGPPTTGQGMYKWACNAKILPRVNAIGKARGWHKLVTHWDESQVALAYAELIASTDPAAAANGRASR